MKHYYRTFTNELSERGLRTILDGISLTYNKRTLQRVTKWVIRTDSAFVGETDDYWVLTEPDDNGTGLFIYKNGDFIFKNSHKEWTYGKGLWRTEDIVKTIIKNINYKRG